MCWRSDKRWSEKGQMLIRGKRLSVAEDMVLESSQSEQTAGRRQSWASEVDAWPPSGPQGLAPPGILQLPARKRGDRAAEIENSSKGQFPLLPKAKELYGNGSKQRERG